MASKKLPKKVKVSVLSQEQSKKDDSKQKHNGSLARVAQEALREVKADDHFQKKVQRYNYKKGSPKNKKIMNHEVPEGHEKKAMWLWISVGSTLFVVFFLWVGTLFYLDFFQIEQNKESVTDLNIITEDIKKSYSDFTESLGSIGEQIDDIKSEVNNSSDNNTVRTNETQPKIEQTDNSLNEGGQYDKTTDDVNSKDILKSPGLEVQDG